VREWGGVIAKALHIRKRNPNVSPNNLLVNSYIESIDGPVVSRGNILVKSSVLSLEDPMRSPDIVRITRSDERFQRRFAKASAVGALAMLVASGAFAKAAYSAKTDGRKTKDVVGIVLTLVGAEEFIRAAGRARSKSLEYRRSLQNPRT